MNPIVFRWGMVALMAVAVIALLGVNAVRFGWFEREPALQCPAVMENALIRPEFTLVDGEGITRTYAEFRGKPLVVYLGFTFCPDICPTTLWALGEATRSLSPEDRAGLNTVFITIDPERDTPQVVSDYAKSPEFPEGLVGLTGTRDQIDGVVAAFKGYARRVELPGSAAEYTMDHSDILYFFTADGKLSSVGNSLSSLPDLTRQLRCVLQQS